MKLVPLLLLLLQCGLAGSVPVTTPEYQIKAVFLFNFTRFVEWPREAFPDEQTPMVIGILGDDPFGAFLDDTVHGESVNGRPLLIQRYRRVEDIKTCHVLFISRSEADRLPEIFASLKGRNLLTVGDVDGFSRSGGVIRLATVQNKVRLRISLNAATAANLTISSKLLRPAEIVAAGED
jgi:hypothetical protein